MIWRLRTRNLEFARQPLVMGIVNVTPDSFSDGGLFESASAAIAHGIRLARSGADLLDIGGESTRPGSEPVDTDEELRRVLPVVDGLRREVNLPLSVDTSKASVARAAIDAGADIVNDVTGLAGDPDMIPLVRESGAGVCVMHMQGAPQSMQNNPLYTEVVEEVYEFLANRRDSLVAEGIPLERICLDPGIGFGKTHEHNLELLRRADRFLELGCTLLVGHSRKGFIRKFSGDPSREQIGGTLAVSMHLARAGVHVLRVHDVSETVHALRVLDAIG